MAAPRSLTLRPYQTSPMVRYEEVELTEEELASLAGRYYSTELELWLDVRLEEGGLVIERLRGERVELDGRGDLTFTGHQSAVVILAERRTKRPSHDRALRGR